MKSPLERAVLGALIGHNLALPLQNLRGFRRLPFYSPIPTRMQPDATWDWWIAASAFRTWGDPRSLNDFRRKHLVDRAGALAFAEQNSRCGFQSPLTGSLSNPLQNDASAFGRALYWGLALDTSLAFDDLSYDHGGYGLRCTLATTILVSSLLAGESLSAAVAQCIPLLDAASRQAVDEATALPLADDEVMFTQLRKIAGTENPDDARLALLAIIVGLRNTAGFDAAILTVAGLGVSPFATSVVAAIMAATKTDDLTNWSAPLGKHFVGTGMLSGVEMPATIDEFAASVALCAPSEAPFTVAPDLEPDQATRPPLGEVVQSWVVLLGAEPRQQLTSQVILRLPSSWQPSHKMLELGIEFLGPMTVQSQVSGNGPVHTRPVETILAEGQKLAQPLLVEPRTTSATLSLNGESEVALPIPPCMQLYVAGPFTQPSDGLFVREQACERTLNESEVFAGRSGLGVKWELKPFSACQFQPEELFLNGPGVVCLATIVELTAGSTYTLVFSASPGGVVTHNGQEFIRYLDTHVPTHRAAEPYGKSFVSTGRTTFVVRMLRPDVPERTAALYLLDDRGHLVSLSSQQF